MPAQALPFLCFAKEKEAKERRLRAQVWLRQTSLTPRDFSGGLATCGYAASNMQALVPQKTAFRSAAPADWRQACRMGGGYPGFKFLGLWVLEAT